MNLIAKIHLHLPRFSTFATDIVAHFHYHFVANGIDTFRNHSWCKRIEMYELFLIKDSLEGNKFKTQIITSN